EGYTSVPEYAGVDVVENNDGKNIDYATCHIWVENWAWYNPKNNDQTYDSSVQKMSEYLKRHVEAAIKLGKPLVVEEFGIARDNGSFEPAAPVNVRNDYYAKVFDKVYQYASSN